MREDKERRHTSQPGSSEVEPGLHRESIDHEQHERGDKEDEGDGHGAVSTPIPAARSRWAFLDDELMPPRQILVAQPFHDIPPIRNVLI